jgi:threonyl-tRNA synthetase
MQIPFQPSELTEQQFLSTEVLALTVWRLFPNVVLVGGGVNSIGFYYDFIFEQPLTESMFELIEVHMHRFGKEEHPLRSISMMRENAQTLFEHQGHFLLAERAGNQSANIIDLVQIGDFYDLCPPLSLTNAQEMGHVKLIDSMEFTQELEEDVTITRLIGRSEKTARDLKRFLKSYDSFLKKKDHRTLGPKLNLFSFSRSMGSLGVIWHAKGLQLQQFLFNWLKSQLPEAIDEISTPIALLQDFSTPDAQCLESFDFEGQDYCLRSSLLFQHLEFLRQFPFESEDLPKRVLECTPFFRQIQESQRWGLLNQCNYKGEQATICCLRRQVASELISSLHFIEQIITIFDFEAQWYLIASRQKTPKARQEQEAVNWLKQAIQDPSRLFPYFPEIHEEEGEGPRLELRVRDVLGREWPVSRLGVIQSIQDVSLVDHPEEKLVIITRQVWESLDRLIALLIERYEGALPFWLVPEQVRVLAIGEANRVYARQVSQHLQQAGLRVKLDLRQSKLGVRVHEAEKEQVPYVVLIGEQERVKRTISVRAAEKFNQSQSVDIETFVARLNAESLSPRSIEGKTDRIGESKSLES